MKTPETIITGSLYPLYTFQNEIFSLTLRGDPRFAHDSNCQEVREVKPQKSTGKTFSSFKHQNEGLKKKKGVRALFKNHHLLSLAKPLYFQVLAFLVEIILHF